MAHWSNGTVQLWLRYAEVAWAQVEQSLFRPFDTGQSISAYGRDVKTIMKSVYRQVRTMEKNLPKPDPLLRPGDAICAGWMEPDRPILGLIAPPENLPAACVHGVNRAIVRMPDGLFIVEFGGWPSLPIC